MALTCRSQAVILDQTDSSQNDLAVAIRLNQDYTGTHLNDSPVEVRLNIWRLVYKDIQCGIDDDTYEQRASPFNGLLSASRKIRAEVMIFWPRTMIPYHHASNLSDISRDRLTNLTTGLSKSLNRDFRYLSIELPNRPTPGFLVQVAHGLRVLKNHLQGLSISFVGDDAHGTETGYYGCGLQTDRKVPAQILPSDGACHREKDVIINLIEQLTQLRKLKLANFNRPIFRRQIGYKPFLNILELTCDSRSQQYRFGATGSALEWQPPKGLKKLTLSANSIIGAVNIARRSMQTLEELTYFVPSSRWQQEGSVSNYMADTINLFKSIAESGWKIRRFRLCIEGPETEWSASDLIGGIKQWLPLTRLEYLEFHANFNSQYFGRELIDALPRSLKHLHVSLELVPIRSLREGIADRYFRAQDPANIRNGHHAAGRLERVTYPDWQTEAIKMDLLRLNGALTDRVRNSHLFDAFKDYYPHFGGFASNPRGFEMDRLILSGKPGLRELKVKDLITKDDDGGEYQEKRAHELPKDLRKKYYRRMEDYLRVVDAEKNESAEMPLPQQHYPDVNDCQKVTTTETDFYEEEPPRTEELVSLLDPEIVMEKHDDTCKHEHWKI